MNIFCFMVTEIATTVTSTITITTTSNINNNNNKSNNGTVLSTDLSSSLSLPCGVSLGCSEEDGFQVWMLAGNILNKQQTDVRQGVSSSLVIARFANNATQWQIYGLGITSQSLGLGLIFGTI